MSNGRLIVAPGMDDATVERIKAGFAARLGHEVCFDIRRDASVIGGFIASIDARVYDASVKTQLETLRRSLEQ